MATQSIPLFPLSLTAFPTETVNLHIFEPRYRQLFQECEVSGTTFGIVPVLDSKLADIGTEMKLHRIVKRYDDGKMDVSTVAIRTFRLQEYQQEWRDKMYPGGSVEFLPWDKAPDPVAAIQIVDLLNLLYKHMQIDNVEVPPASQFEVASVIHKVGLNLEQEVAVLRIPSEAERQQFVLDHLKVFVPHVIEMEELRRKAALNGHFKTVRPPNL